MTEDQRALTERLDALVALFYQAEQRIKPLEYLTDELPCPAVNELRYAGHHISRAWQAKESGGVAACHDELDKALKHCRRAIYDAHEIGIQYHLQRIKLFKDDYRRIVVSAVVSDCHEMYRDARKALQFLEEVAQRFWNDRDSYYAECKRHFSVVEQVADTLDAAREDLNASINRERKKVIWVLAGFAVTLFAATISAVAIVISG